MMRPLATPSEDSIGSLVSTPGMPSTPGGSWCAALRGQLAGFVIMTNHNSLSRMKKKTAPMAQCGIYTPRFYKFIISTTG
jgi:hypothetical protein